MSKETQQLSLSISLPESFTDHCIEGRPVFPAVDALQNLARAVQQAMAHHNVCSSSRAAFMRLLPLAPGSKTVAATARLDPHQDGSVTATLITRAQAGRTTMTRSIEHVSVLFRQLSLSPDPPLDLACVPAEPGLTVTAKDLYLQLVPFGPAYQNARDPIFLAPDGACAWVSSPDHDSSGGPLGSPFPLDAAFHVACAWGQRYAGLVTFPTGYHERFVFRLTRPGEKYFCRIIPRPADRAGSLLFDIWLYLRPGTPAEAVLGLRMEDITHGRAKAPAWVQTSDQDQLSTLCSPWPSFRPEQRP